MNNFNPDALVDMIGALKARLAPELAQLKFLETSLKEHGAGRYCGDDYEATVSLSEREVLDMKAVRAKLSRQFIAANTTTTEVTTLRVTARILKVAA
jgi:hypothetical protein